MTARLRPELADLPAYTPGKTVPGAIKIASNETVHGPLPSVRAAIEKAADNINRYPDNGYVELKGTPNLLIRSQMLYPLSYGRMYLVVWPTSQPRRRREDLNLRSPLRATTH